MARVPALQGLEGGGAVAHFADDDPVGPHAQGVANQVRHADGKGLAPGHDRYDVPGRTLQLGRILNEKDPVLRKGRLGQDGIGQGRLAGTCSAGNQYVAAF
ncbi:hypothetical protein D3C72_1953000 [compost metagenome]